MTASRRTGAPDREASGSGFLKARVRVVMPAATTRILSCRATCQHRPAGWRQSDHPHSRAVTSGITRRPARCAHGGLLTTRVWSEEQRLGALITAASLARRHTDRGGNLPGWVIAIEGAETPNWKACSATGLESSQRQGDHFAASFSTKECAAPIASQEAGSALLEPDRWKPEFFRSSQHFSSRICRPAFRLSLGAPPVIISVLISRAGGFITSGQRTTGTGAGYQFAQAPNRDNGRELCGCP